MIEQMGQNVKHDSGDMQVFYVLFLIVVATFL